MNIYFASFLALSISACAGPPQTVALGERGSRDPVAPADAGGSSFDGGGNGGQSGSVGSAGIGGQSGSVGNAGAPGIISRDQFCTRAPKTGIAIPGTNECTADLGKKTFLFGLCSCNDLNITGTLNTAGFNSTTGVSEKSGSVGVTSGWAATTLFNIGGSLWVGGKGVAAGQPAFSLIGINAVSQELHVGGDLAASSFLTIGGDAYLSGSISSVVPADVAGALHIPNGASAGGWSPLGGILREPVTVADPCNCDNPIDVAAIVRSFENANDNAASGIGRDALIAPEGKDLTLDCGRYYFDGVDIGSATTVHLKGRTAIFVNGDFNMLSLFTMSLDPGADLDLFITGNVTMVGLQEFGLQNAPARIRMYVGGTSVNLLSLATLGVNLYARNALLSATGTLSVWGSLYVKEMDVLTLADFHYDSAILDIPGCEPPGTCKDCHDCGSGESRSCNGGICGSCKTSADCCAPLLCNSGECIPPGVVLL